MLGFEVPFPLAGTRARFRPAAVLVTLTGRLTPGRAPAASRFGPAGTPFSCMTPAGTPLGVSRPDLGRKGRYRSRLWSSERTKRDQKDGLFPERTR